MQYIPEGVKIEISCRSLIEPSEKIEIHSMIEDAYPDEDFSLSTFAVPTVVPGRTFLEKVFVARKVQPYKLLPRAYRSIIWSAIPSVTIVSRFVILLRRNVFAELKRPRYSIWKNFVSWLFLKIWYAVWLHNLETLLTDSTVIYFLDGTKSLKDRITEEFNDEKMCNIKTKFNRLSVNIATYP